MKHLFRVLLFAAVFALLGRGAAHVLVRIPAGTVGVRAVKWGGGIEERDFGCGLELGIPGLHEWYLLEAGSLALSFAAKPSQPGDRGPLEIRTRDNNSVKIEATIAYRIRAGEAHMLVREGLEKDFKRRARSTVEDALRAELGNLTSEDWFDTDRRLAELARIEPLIDDAFGEFHLDLLSLQIHSSTFPAAFEEKLQEKQVYAQTAKLSAAKRLVEDAGAEAGRIIKETEAAEKKALAEADKRLQEEKSASLLAVTTITARASRYDRETRAQADLRYERLVAEGQLALDQASAEGERLRLAALAGDGGELYLAREAARNLRIDRVELDATDPRVPLLLDLDELSGILIGGEE